jgi:acetyltransferase-like isoleucine patch superfamily enzyme
VSGHVLPAAGQPARAPTWEHGGRSVAQNLRRATVEVREGFARWVLCRGNKIAYLRRLGVRIGRGTTVIARVRDFGTEPWLIELGSRVSIAAGVLFITHDGATRVFRDRIPEGSIYGNRFAPIRVLDNCIVGARSILMPGVTLGPDSVVGAGSIVTRDVPPRSVAAGVPAKVLCSLDEYVERYRREMIPGLSSDRAALRRQLTLRFWGEER